MQRTEAAPAQAEKIAWWEFSASAAFAGWGIIFVVAAALSLSVGALHVPLADVARALLSVVPGLDPVADAVAQAVVIDLRLPRTAMAAAVGASLAVSGAVLQGLFRNPLADPGLIGVSSGAALFAAIAIVVTRGLASAPFASSIFLPLAAFVGGAGTVLLVAKLATSNGQTSMSTMLLAGVAFNALMAAGLGLLLFLADDAALRDITFWILGSVGGATWQVLAVTGPVLVVTMVAMIRLGRSLDGLAMGETVGRQLGLDVQSIKRHGILLSALAVGAAVSTCGAIGFVGLVVPHLWRLWHGPRHRVLLGGSALMGATLLLVADIGARLLVAPAEIPVGVITALAGAPFFLFLLLQRRGSVHA